LYLSSCSRAPEINADDAARKDVEQKNARIATSGDLRNLIKTSNNL